MDSDFLKKIIESNSKVIETKLKNAKRIEESNNTLSQILSNTDNSNDNNNDNLNDSLDVNTQLSIDDSHISPPKEFNEYIKKNFSIQGKWRIEGKGLNIFYNSQPQTLDAMKESFEVKNFYNNYSSILYIKQDTGDEGDSRYVLCLTTPDRSDGVSYRNTYGFQPGYFDNTDPNSIALSIQDYDDNGWYTLRDFERDENGKIKKIRGYYREAGYDARNRYQVPTTGAIELTWLTDDTELDFKSEEEGEVSTMITRNKPQQSILDSMKNELDIWFYKQDYYYDFKPISSSRYDQTTVFPILNKNFDIVGEGFGLFKYTLDKGQTTCVSQFRFTFFNEKFQYDNLRNYSIEKFTFPENATIKSKQVSSTYFFAPNYKNQHIIDTFDVTWNQVDISTDVYSMEFIEGENSLVKNLSFGSKLKNNSSSINVKAKSDGSTFWTIVFGEDEDEDDSGPSLGSGGSDNQNDINLIANSNNNSELLNNLKTELKSIIENVDTKYSQLRKDFIIPSLLLKEENKNEQLLEQLFFTTGKVNNIYNKIVKYFETNSNNNVTSILLNNGKLAYENVNKLSQLINSLKFEENYGSFNFNNFKENIDIDINSIKTLLNEIDQDISLLDEINSNSFVNLNNISVVDKKISKQEENNSDFTRWISNSTNLTQEYNIKNYPNIPYSFYFSFLLSKWVTKNENKEMFDNNLNIIFIENLYSDTYY